MRLAPTCRTLLTRCMHYLAAMSLFAAVGLSSPRAVALPAAHTCPGGCTRPGGIIRITSASNLQLGDEALVRIKLENISNLSGIELELAFDPTILQVQDDKPGTVDTQILPGDLPNPEHGFVAQNAADNKAGVIAYAVAILSPNPAANGYGTLATIRFKAIGTGDSAITVTHALAVGADSCCLNMTTYPGIIEAGPPANGSVTGHVHLEARTDYGGVAIKIADKQTLTASDGTYVVHDIAPGVYEISAQIDNYVQTTKQGVLVSAGDTTYLPDVTLLAGDMDESCQIDIFDLVTLGSAYGTSPPIEPDADFNQDNKINIFDLVLLAGNYGVACPGTW